MRSRLCEIVIVFLLRGLTKKIAFIRLSDGRILDESTVNKHARR